MTLLASIVNCVRSSYYSEYYRFRMSIISQKCHKCIKKHVTRYKNTTLPSYLFTCDLIPVTSTNKPRVISYHTLFEYTPGKNKSQKMQVYSFYWTRKHRDEMQNNSRSGSSLRQSIRHICLIPVKEARAAEAQIVVALFSKSYSTVSRVMSHLVIQILCLRRSLKPICNTSNLINI